VRFLRPRLSFVLLILGLNAVGSVAPVMAAPIPPATKDKSIALTQNDRAVIRGNGVEFTMPAGFVGGSPSSQQTKAAISAAAKAFPSMASFVQIIDNDPSILRAIATNTSAPDNPSVALVTRLPVPADVSLASIQQMMATSMPAMLPPQFKLVENNLRNLGTRQIVQLGIDIDYQGVKLKQTIGLFKEGDEVYQVTYVYAPETAPQATTIFQQILSTFKVVPTKAAQALI
jgi:hypothetical protein